MRAAISQAQISATSIMPRKIRACRFSSSRAGAVRSLSGTAATSVHPSGAKRALSIRHGPPPPSNDRLCSSPPPFCRASRLRRVSPCGFAASSRPACFSGRGTIIRPSSEAMKMKPDCARVSLDSVARTELSICSRRVWICSMTSCALSVMANTQFHGRK
ncbi:hypothetical protein D3C72_1740820 [compost metagenome]